MLRENRREGAADHCELLVLTAKLLVGPPPLLLARFVLRVPWLVTATDAWAGRGSAPHLYVKALAGGYGRPRRPICGGGDRSAGRHDRTVFLER